MVVVYHAQSLLRGYESRIALPPSIFNSTPTLSTLGASGVDLFFVISGFIMAYITYNKRGIRNVLPFIKRRLIRIVPVYWLYTAVMAGLLFFIPTLFSTARFDAQETLLSLLFIPYLPAVNATAPVLEVGWTLSYEMYFYGLIAVGLFFGYRVVPLLLGLFFTACVLARYAFPIDSPVMNLVTNPILFEFFLGYLCGYMYVTKVPIPTYLAALFLASGVAGYVLWAMALTTLPLAVFAFLIVTGSVFLEKSVNLSKFQFLARIGDSSYTLYLTHYLLIPALGKVCIATGFWNYLPPSAFILVALTMCVAAGYALYVLLERPLVTWLSHWAFPVPSPAGIGQKKHP